MKKNYIKGILATVKSEGFELTEYKTAVLDVNDEKALAKALGCVCPKELIYTINGIGCHIYADDSGVRDENAVATMIIEKNGKYIRTIIGNIFICKDTVEDRISLTDEEQAIILSNLKKVYFGYNPSLYLHIKQ